MGNSAPAREEIPTNVANRTSRDSSSKVRVFVDITVVVGKVIVVVSRCVERVGERG